MGKHYYLPFEKNGKFDYNALTEYEKYQLSFHPERPRYLDYLTIFKNPESCFENTEFGNNLIQTHRAVFEWKGSEYPVMLVGQQSGPTSDYAQLKVIMKDPDRLRRWNHGMPTAASYERAIRAIEIANEEKRLVITMVDTPGADPTEESEAGGIAWRIGKTIHELADARVPTISVILNRGCSGGAIALTGCDVVLAMEYSTYLVITPEACSSILFHTRSKANRAAEVSQITSREGFEHGIIDELVPEPEGPAHRFPEKAIKSLGEILGKYIPELSKQDRSEIFDNRVSRWRKIGRWDVCSEDKISNVQMKKSNLPEPNRNGYIKRHAGCRNERGERFYDPVNFRTLQKNNYVCARCGKRYVRPSAWDYLDLIIDYGSFEEHEDTRHILDKDILNFPGYVEKLEKTRESTGLCTAMFTGDGEILGNAVVYCGNGFEFFGGSFCMSTGEKIWLAAEHAVRHRRPLVLQAAGGGARMHEGCSSMVSIPKAHVALTRVEKAGLPVITIITDPTLGGVAIGYGSRGIRMFEKNAGNIGFSGKRVIEQYTGHRVSRDFQTTHWLERHGHVEHVVSPDNIREEIARMIREFGDW